MANTGVVRLFRRGRSQIVRLPRNSDLKETGCASAGSAREYCWNH